MADDPDGTHAEKKRMAEKAQESIWVAVHTYYLKYGMVRHQVESFENFVDVLLPHIVQENSDIAALDKYAKQSHHIHFCNVNIQPPTTSAPACPSSRIRLNLARRIPSKACQVSRMDSNGERHHSQRDYAG